jgi:Uma2 family endonuclease
MAAALTYEPVAEATLTGIPLPAKLRLARPLTDDELIEFSERHQPLRVERNAKGELEIMTPVGGDGSRFESYLTWALQGWTELHGGACFSSNGGFSLPDGSALSPDAAWISTSRWEALRARERRSLPPLCPDFVIELRSATDRRKKLERKMGTWIANGAQLAWLVDPLGKTVTVYRAGAAAEVLERPEVVEAGVPVAGFRLVCARFWAE